MNRQRFLGACLVAMAALVAVAPAAVQAQPLPYPAKPIRWIVPSPAGTGADIAARTIGAQLAIDEGQPVLVENHTGANTALGAIEAARAPPDGYTVLSADNGTLVFNPLLYRKLSYDPARDFVPVTLMGRMPMVLIVGPSSGVKDARAFIEDARAYPGKVNYASAGTGSPHHLAMELLQRQAGLRMVHVPYRSTAFALADVAGGQLPAMMCDLAAAGGYIKAGRVRALAVASATRLPQLPGVPTFAELGIPAVEAALLLGLAAPAGTPPEVVERLQQSVASAIHSPAVQARLAELGIEPVGSTPAQFAAQIEGESVRWHGLIKGLGLRLD